MAEFIVWNDKYSVLIPSLDLEHKKIIGIINQMYEKRLKEDPKILLGRTLQGLIDYAMTHFTHEEQLLQKFNFLEAKKHRLDHRSYVKKISTFQQDVIRKPEIILEDLFEYLKEWWLYHIQVEDKRYGPFLSSKGVK